VWGLVIALLATAGLAGGWYLGEGRYTDAPAVLNLTSAEAVDTLAARGFEVEFLDPVFDESVPDDGIVDQDPDPNAQVLRGGTITLVASRGPDRREVPSVLGSTREAATAALSGVGLAVGEVTEVFDPRPVGTVVASDPVAGDRLRPDATVALSVSKGPELLPVPDTVGRPQAEAEAAVTEAGFRTSLAEVFSEDVARGVVLSQDPAAGTAERGSTVALRVSRGPELVTVPDVTGQPRADATRVLEGLGLRVRELSIPGPGRVRSTDPGAGAQVRKGSQITVYVF